MKKMFSLALALIMALALCVPTFAANVTVEGAVDGETYNAYKVFDYTAAGSNYAYTMEKGSQWESVVDAYTVKVAVTDEQTGVTEEKVVDVFTLTPSATDATKLVVTINEGASFSTDADAKAFADYLMANIADKVADETVVAEDGAAAFTGLDAGYYFMDTSLGALCSLMNAHSSQVLEEKNAEPTIDKKIVVDGKLVEETNTSISKMVDYCITVTDGKGTDSAITVYDQMEAGLSLKKDSFVITDDADVVDAKNYTITIGEPTNQEEIADGTSFNIVFTDAYVASLKEGAKIYINYSAKLNQFAEISGESNDNNAWLTYSAQTSETETVKVYTYKFDLVKTDKDGNKIEGASFKLYDAEQEGTVIGLTDEGNGVYRVSDMGDDATIVVGKAVINGLGNGIYWLEETAAPDGYNLLTARVKVEIKDGNLLFGDGADADGKYVEGEGGVIVVNQTGSILPSTGGVGTTIFYTVGGLMMAAAVVLFVTKKKLAVQE